MSSLFGQTAGSGTSGDSVAKNGTLSVFQTTQQQQQQQQPIWFQNQKKRIIPNHLVPKKKPSFQITSSNKKDGVRDSSSSSDKKSSSLLSSTNEFNLLSFGGQQSQQRKLLDKAGDTSIDLTKYDETINETFVSNDDFFNSYDEDLPPTRSIHDFNNEILNSLANKPVEKIDSFINRDPKSFNNIFNASNLSDSKQDDAKLNEKKEKEAINPLVNNESAIIVFGYPESLTNQIIQHFKEFGDILEDFETNQKLPYSLLNSKHNQSSKKVVPLFVGKNWIKLTFDNPASAIDALQENGSVFNGILLGVIPYTKNAIEKLQKRSITSQEDIGGKNLLDLSIVRSEKLDTNTNDNVTGGSNSNPVSNNKFEMKDGTQLFLKPDGEQQKDKNVKQEKLGIIGNLSRYIFGFHEL
ncbi:Nup53/35/40-type RNA recognition motif-domain-containing protein [Scheffersomyces coipomensis]|uniref:Nup53/35/40-type RNA recognition motif-domain-containing protein n=1 Tax=Scheffersomyces coipomensis TaxID=1788519 RepID=UPI00315C5C57